MNLVAPRWWSMLFMPSSVLIVALALGVFLMMRAWRCDKRPGEARFACGLTVTGLIMLYVASTPLVARWMAETLERQNPPVDPVTMPVADAIVVLGGSMYATVGPDGTTLLYARHSSDRFETAMQAFNAARAPIIAFGGGGTGVPGTPTEGEWNCARAIARGAPADRAIAGPVALYTSDESEGIARVLRERGVKRIILCSSAVHLPRARMNYEKLGFEVTPLPSDFATRGTAEDWSWALLIPRGMALSQVDAGVKEWMGLLGPVR